MKRLLVAAMLVLAGCGTGPAAGQGAHGYRVFVERMGSTELTIVTTSAPTPVSLPGGFLTADGSQLFSSGGQTFDHSSGSGGTTTMNVYETRSGALARKLQLTGQWSWVDGGTSPDGRWVALTSPKGFLVVNTTSGKQYPVTLKGHFNFDALSNDGQHLFFIETLVGSAYQVRLVNVFSDTLQVDPVAIKGPEVSAMSGYKLTAVASPGGDMLYSLYGRTDGRPPFVHALNLDQGFAYCIDLPAMASQNPNYADAAASGWALSLDPGHSKLYASSALGQVAAIDTNQYTVVRSAGLTAPKATSFLPPFIVDAAAKGFEGLGASAVDPSGRWLYVAWGSGFLPVDTTTLKPAALRDSGDHLTNLAMSSDGLHLFAVSNFNSLADLDPGTGIRRATIGGLSEPWRILRVEAAA